MSRAAQSLHRGRSSRVANASGDSWSRDTADRPATTTPVPPPSPDAPLTDREPTRRRLVGALSAWLGTSTWPAYGAAGITAAYGILKAYWVFGGTALWSIAPLDPEMIERARSGTAPRWFEIADAVSVALAAAGVVFALATVRPRRWLPTWLVRWSLLPLAAFMVLRALLSIPGDMYEIASGGTLTHTARWDLVLWSPLFLIWGLLWAATALTYAQRSRRPDRQQPDGAGASSAGEPAKGGPLTHRVDVDHR